MSTSSIVVISSCVLGMLLATAVSAEPPVALVQAKVISVGKEDSNGVIPATLEITHGYSGADKLRGQTFRDEHRTAGWTSGNYALLPFQVGEQGIWVLERRKDEYTPAEVRNFPFRIRCRKVEMEHFGKYVETKHYANHYANTVEFAESYERVEKAPAKDRGGELRKLITAKNPLVCGWAVRTIGGSASDADRQFLDEIAPSVNDLPLAAQIAFDEVYSKIKKGDWTAAKSRAQLLRSWVTAKWDETQTRFALSRIGQAELDEELTKKEAVELIRTAAENKTWPWPPRRGAILGIGQLSQHETDDKIGYDWLVEQVRTHPDAKVRLAAAESIATWIPLYPRRLKAIEDHLATEKDDKVAKVLRAAVQKAKEADKKK